MSVPTTATATIAIPISGLPMAPDSTQANQQI
jgi:hypothetical protein